MSSFIGSASGGTGGVVAWSAQPLDNRLLAAGYQQDLDYPGLRESTDPYSFATPWWPRSSIDATGGELIGDMMGEVGWENPSFNSGAVSKVVFQGVTRDGYGSILGGCQVKLLKTADGAYGLGGKDKILDETTSDATTGAFTLMSNWCPDTHYIVSYKAGSPDVQGTTVNTLIGA